LSAIAYCREGLAYSKTIIRVPSSIALRDILLMRLRWIAVMKCIWSIVATLSTSFLIAGSQPYKLLLCLCSSPPPTTRHLEKAIHPKVIAVSFGLANEFTVKKPEDNKPTRRQRRRQ